MEPSGKLQARGTGLVLPRVRETVWSDFTAQPICSPQGHFQKERGGSGKPPAPLPPGNEMQALLFSTVKHTSKLNKSMKKLCPAPRKRGHLPGPREDPGLASPNFHHEQPWGGSVPSGADCIEVIDRGRGLFHFPNIRHLSLGRGKGEAEQEVRVRGDNS